jgi:hypothetical protein
LLKFSNYFFCILALLIFYSCEKSNQDPAPLAEKLSRIDSLSLRFPNLNPKALSVVTGEIITALEGNFSNAKDVVYAVLIDDQTKNLCHLKIKFIRKFDTYYQAAYSSPSLEGIKKSFGLEKAILPGLSYQLLYFDSGGYYLGSGGGEIFSYLIDAEMARTYSALLRIGDGNPPQILIPRSCNRIEVRNYFIKKLQGLYPEAAVRDVETLPE